MTLITLAYTDRIAKWPARRWTSPRAPFELWDAGHRDGMRAMALYHGGSVGIGRPGLTIVPCGASYQP